MQEKNFEKLNPEEEDFWENETSDTEMLKSINELLDLGKHS